MPAFCEPVRPVMVSDEVLGAMIDERAQLFEHTWHSLRLLLCGYAAGVAAGFFAGILIGWFARARYWGMPLLKALGPLPATALVALVMMRREVSTARAAAAPATSNDNSPPKPA